MKIIKIFLTLFIVIFIAEANEVNEKKSFTSVLNSVTKIEKKDEMVELNMLNSSNYFDKHKNFINSSRDILFLKKIIGAYKKNINTINKTNTDEETDITDELYSNDYNFRTFIVYLKSIMFLSKNMWAVWVNDIKITNSDNSKNNEFYIRDIDSKKIVLQWNISEFKWNYVNKMNSIPEHKYKVLDDGSIELVLILYSNQSYLPFIDQTVEGRYIEKFENNSIKDNKYDKETNEEQNDNIDLEKIINSL